MTLRQILIILLLLSPLVSGQVKITEFMASNDTGLEDENGDRPDWIELTNSGSSAIDLDGWSLTDNATNSQKWIFPAVTMGPGEILVVFASGKDRSVLGLTLHTNFSLKKGGEYLALFEPGGIMVATEFSPSYPPQATDVSFGRQDGDVVESPVTLNTPGHAGVPTSQANFDAQFVNWNTSLSGSFTGSSWQAVELGIGYEANNSGIPYGGWIGANGDVQTKMYNNNASVFIRVPFMVTNASEVFSAALRMRWDDGFVAYLNGVQIGANLEPATLGWDAAATMYRDDVLNEDPTQFNIDLGAAPLNEGANILAIHGMNNIASSSDMLVQPELVLTRAGSSAGTPVYFTSPSPGALNGPGDVDLAPLFDEVTEVASVQPTGLAESPMLLLTATVRDGTDPISQVRAFYRTMFGSEIMVSMLDNGVAPDVTADDGVYSVEIPTSQVGPGEMLRWRFEVTDTNSGLRSSPLYGDPLDADRYYGTVALDGDLSTSDLPVLQTFVENASAVNTAGGDRVSLYYLGEFYDNVQMDVHGQTSASFAKKSYDLDFNKGNRFTWKVGEKKAKDINLLSNWADKSKVRNTLAYEMYALGGNEHHFAFPVRVERNGAFFSVADMVEDGDDRYLERMDLDPSGALYKMYDPMVNVNTAGKKTRQNENRQDLQDLFNRVNLGVGTTQLRRNYYDHINMASLVNYLASNQVIGITDSGLKNYYWYRDTEGTEEWRPLPWDVDLSFGHHWGGFDGQYFNDDLKTGIRLFNFNPVWQAMYDTSEFKEMLARRFETLRREVLQPNGTPVAEDWVRTRMIDIEASTNRPGVTSDSDLDFAAWGSWGDGLSSLPYSMRLYNDWLPAHRGVVFGSGASIRGTSIPSTQPLVPNVVIDSIDFLPSSGSQEEEYVIIKNNESSSLDLSGWTLSGAIDFTFQPGTVILQGNGTSGSSYQGLIHVAKNPAAFRARSTGPTGSEFRYVQGPSSGQLSARGESVTLKNAEGTLIDTFIYSGTPTDTQDSLRITEINYNPAEPTSAELLMQPGLSDRDFEFIELMNIGASTLDISGATFTEGIDYTFPSSTNVAAGDRVLLVKNPTAFTLRYGDPGVPVFGPYSGLLDNSGETLNLEDAIGENILKFRYEDSWYPNSDGNGSSLVLRSTTAAYDQYGNPATWGSSVGANGSPGTTGSGYQTHFNGWQAINYVESDHLVGMPGHEDSDADGDGLTTWDEYALGSDVDVPNDFVVESDSIGTGAAKKFGLSVTRRRFTSDVLWELLSSNSIPLSTPIGSPVETNISVLSPTLESVFIHDPDPMSDENEQFYQLRITPLELP